MYYKILPKNLKTYGYQYHIGINRMDNVQDFGKRFFSEEFGTEYSAGLYFSDSKDALIYCHSGDIIATVEIADDANLEYWGNGEYSTDALEIISIRPLWDINTLQELEREGVDIPIDLLISWGEELGKNEEVIQWLKNKD